jgi:hypothetical protein
VLRIKTVEEFKRDFGEDFRQNLHWNEHGHMEYLYGKVLSPSQEQLFLKNGECTVPNECPCKLPGCTFEKWYIERDFVTSKSMRFDEHRRRLRAIE